MIGPLGFAGKNLSRRGFHAFLAFVGLTLTVASTTFLLLLGQGLALRLDAKLSPSGTFGINWLFFGFLWLSLILIIIVGIVSTSYLVSSMINQRMRDIGVIKAAGSLPGRLFSYAFAEGLLIISSSCLTGGIVALGIYLVWSWPSPNFGGQIGPISNAGETILVLVPMVCLFLSGIAARYQLGMILRSTATGAITGHLSGLNLTSLGKPVHVKRLGSAFNLATRNVSRDRELNRTLVRIIICIFLTVVVLTGALVSADTSKSYVQRAMPENVLIVGSGAMLNQYSLIGTSFSSTTAIPSFNYTDPGYLINATTAGSFRGLSGVETVDTRLVTTTTVAGFVKAHLVTNETSGNYNNVYVPEQSLGSSPALVVGIDPRSVVGDWYTSDGFLTVRDANDTMVAGDSFVGGIVQMPYGLAQVGALGIRYNVKGALVDPLNTGRVLYARVGSVENATQFYGYNLFLVKTDNNPATTAAVRQLASAYGLSVGSLDSLRDSNISFLENTWSYFFILPVLTLALTCGIMLSYLATNFSRRFNDYLVLRILGAKSWFSLRLLLWEAWGLLAVCMVIAVPVAWVFSIFFILPEASIPLTDIGLSGISTVVTLTLVAFSSALIYSRRLRMMTVKDLRG